MVKIGQTSRRSQCVINANTLPEVDGGIISNILIHIVLVEWLGVYLFKGDKEKKKDERRMRKASLELPHGGEETGRGAFLAPGYNAVLQVLLRQMFLIRRDWSYEILLSHWVFWALQDEFKMHSWLCFPLCFLGLDRQNNCFPLPPQVSIIDLL